MTVRGTMDPKGLLVALLVILVATWVLHPQIFAGKVYGGSDAENAAAFQHVGELALQRGETPLWNPYVFTGMPSFASLAFTPGVYPPAAPLKFVHEKLGGPPMGWLLFHLLLAGSTMCLWMRWRGASWTASIMAGVALIFLPKISAWVAHGHGSKMATFAWMPLAFWCTEGICRKGRPIFFFGLAFAVAMQLLRGHVQIAYYSVMGIAVLSIALLWPLFRDKARRKLGLLRLGAVGVAGLLALVTSLVLYLPVLEYQGQSIRGAKAATGEVGGAAAADAAAYDYATNWSLAVGELPTLWWPTAKGYGKASYAGEMPFTDYPNYVGLPILLLVILALFRRRTSWHWALLSLAILATLVALGRHGPFYQVLYDLLPGFAKFRVPVMILALQEIALLALAADGLTALLAILRDEERPAWLRPVGVLLGVAGLGLLVGGTLFADAIRESTIASIQRARPGLPFAAAEPAGLLAVADSWRLGLCLLLSVGAVFLALRRRIPVAAAGAILVLLLLWDMMAVTQPVLHPQNHLRALGRQNGQLVVAPAGGMIVDHHDAHESSQDSELAAFLKAQQERPRLWPMGGASQDTRLASMGIVSLGGYHPAKLRLYEDLRVRMFETNPPAVRLVSMLGAGWLLTDRELPAATSDWLGAQGLPVALPPAWVGAEGVLYRNLNPWPRAWVVGGSRPAGPNSLDQLLDPRFDPRREAILHDAPSPAADPAAIGAEVQLIEEGDHFQRYAVDSPAAGILVTNDIYYPAWEVRIDGQAAPLLRLNHSLRGVAIAAGQSEVEFQYGGGAHRAGLWFGRIGMAIILLGLLGSLALDRRSPGVEEGVA